MGTSVFRVVGSIPGAELLGHGAVVYPWSSCQHPGLLGVCISGNALRVESMSCMGGERAWGIGRTEELFEKYGREGGRDGVWKSSLGLVVWQVGSPICGQVSPWPSQRDSWGC